MEKRKFSSATHSPDLTSVDFFLFLTLKRELAGLTCPWTSLKESGRGSSEHRSRMTLLGSPEVVRVLETSGSARGIYKKEENFIDMLL